MPVREIIEINEELCNGCGVCVSACAEGAIQLVDGKAKLVKDEYCDGLGACLGECPTGALKVVQREAPEFDEQAVETHLSKIGRAPLAAAHSAPQAPPAPQPHHAPHAPGGCPGSMMRQLAPKPAAATATAPAATAAPSALQQWPVQLHLVPPTAPYFRDADLLLAADCAAFACGDFHARFLRDHALAIACPKLDDPQGYVDKLAAMITDGGIRSITIVMMQVPCCRGLQRFVDLALQTAGRRVPVRTVIISLEGETLMDETVAA
ncbi:MAG: ATP-binding protein [Armatimonadota bacterium]